MLGHLFGLLSPAVAAAAAPEGLEGGHQAGQDKPGRQHTEDSGEAVQFEGAPVGRRPPLAARVTAAWTGPPLLLQHVQVALLLQLQDPDKTPKKKIRIFLFKKYSFKRFQTAFFVFVFRD